MARVWIERPRQFTLMMMEDIVKANSMKSEGKDIAAGEEVDGEEDTLFPEKLTNVSHL
jgi:hypothetical protein